MNESSIAVEPGLDQQVLPFALRLELNVTDPELIRDLLAHAEAKVNAFGRSLLVPVVRGLAPARLEAASPTPETRCQ